MNIEISMYNGIDKSSMENYKVLKDILINRKVKLPSDVKTIYKVSIDVNPFLKSQISTMKGINLERESLNGLLGSFTLRTKCIIEYSKMDDSIGVENLEFLDVEFIPIKGEINKRGIRGKVRNTFIYEIDKNTIYLSIYYTLAM